MDNESLKQYFKSKVGKIYGILCSKEEGAKNINKRIDNLFTELTAGEQCIFHNEIFVELAFNLQSLKMIDDLARFKAICFKCIGLCNKIAEGLGE